MKYSLILFFCCIAVYAAAQEPKTEITYETMIRWGKEKEYKAKLERYNEKGKEIEEIEYYPSGRIKSWKQYKFDEKGKKVVEELTLNRKGCVVEREVFKYNNEGDRIEKATYNRKGKLTGRKRYEYEYHE